MNGSEEKALPNRDQEDCEVEKTLDQLAQTLEQLLEAHSKLLSVVRLEREALANADLALIQECALNKETQVDAIRLLESARVGLILRLGADFGFASGELTLSGLIVVLQNSRPKLSATFADSLKRMLHVVGQVDEQNRYNRDLIQRSLSHLQKMKANVLGEAAPKTETYTNQGQRANGGAGGRLISREA